MSKSNAAIRFVPEGFRTDGPHLVGRKSANESFLRSFVRHADVESYYSFCYDRDGFDRFIEQVDSFGPKATNPLKAWVSPQRQHQVSEVGCLHASEPSIAEYAWTRRGHDQRSYSLTGLTHTICEISQMEAFGRIFTAPTQPWDALICTSTAVQKTVQNVFDSYAAYIADRFAAPKAELKVQLPIIPLGVECDAYERTTQRATAALETRKRLGIDEDVIVVLFVGRLTAHGKAHPAPMFIALEEAAKRTGKKVCILLSGWFGRKDGEQIYAAAAEQLCPSVKYRVIDGRSPEIRDHIYHTADIFTSLSDNIQESFGLTPLEAMAAGVPVVVSDWDGYRDTVRHEVDGYTVPTLAPPPGEGMPLGERYRTQQDGYSKYMGVACQSTSVDIARCAEAYSALILDPQLRSRMGAAGQQRARETYDWSQIIARFQQLWSDLAEIRASDTPEVCARPADRPAHPLFDDPFRTFDSYPTQSLTGEMTVQLHHSADRATFDAVSSLALNRFFTPLESEPLTALYEAVAQSPNATVGELTEANDDSAAAKRGLVWMAKVGLIQIGDHNR